MNGKRPGGWVALAWRYYRDEKLLAVSADAELLWTHALAFTGEQATDGRIPAGALGLLASKLQGSAEAAAGELVAARLWLETSGGWTFADSWRAWQPTAEQVRNGRERDAKRKALSRSNADNRQDNRQESRTVGEGEGGEQSSLPPDPSAESEIVWKTDDRGNVYVDAPWLRGQT